MSAAQPTTATMRNDGALVVEGALTFDSVPGVLNQTAASIEQAGGLLKIDLDGVTRADSAGIALLVEWMSLAKSKDRDIVFVNVPEQVRSLIRVNGLGASLGIGSSYESV